MGNDLPELLALIESLGRQAGTPGSRGPMFAARSNKIIWLYLEARRDEGEGIPESLSECRGQYHRVVSTMARIAGHLNALSTRYAVWKTLRPHLYNPTDVDILLFDDEGLDRIDTCLIQAGYELSDSGPWFLTYRDPETRIECDLYREAAVSHLVYIDKDSLGEALQSLDIGGVRIPVLSPLAELMGVVTHSVYKEQLFTLADYLTISEILRIIPSQDAPKLVEMASLTGTRIALTISLRLLEEIRAEMGKRPLMACTDVTEMLQSQHPFLMATTALVGRSTRTGAEKGLRLPYRYQPVQLAMMLLERFFASPVSRIGTYRFLSDLLSRKPAGRKLREHLRLHRIRETY